MAKLGLDARLYYLDDVRVTWGDIDSDGVAYEGEDPGLTLVGGVKDVKFSGEKATADVTTRDSGGWVQRMTGMKDVSLEVTVIFDPDDTTQQALIGAWLNNTTIPLAVLDGAVGDPGTMGIWADFDVVKLDKDEPLTEGQATSFSLTIGTSSVAPEWVRVISNM